MTTAWDHLRAGNAEQGLLILREAYARRRSPSHTMELGVAYLWIENYRAALEHFDNAISTDRNPADIFFGMAGAAEWCMDNPTAAINHWVAGLNAKFVDLAGGIHLPLLLFIASILTPAMFSKKRAEQILMDKLSNPQIKNWPGPLARFVLGFEDEANLRQLWLAKNGVRVLPHRKRVTEFYKRILELDRGDLDRAGFRDLMRDIANTSQEEWREESDFLYFLWCEEFFVARHEASIK